MTQPPARSGSDSPWQPPAPSGWPPPPTQVNGPGWYPPGPQQPPYYPPPQPQRRGTNGFAIAALVFGIIGGFVLSVIFGIVALKQIRRSGQSGRGMAITGLVLSGLWAVLVTVAVIVAAATSANRDSSGQITAGGSVSATALQVGDCVNGLEEQDSLLNLPGVPCAQPHEGEVFAVFDLPAGAYPGESAVNRQVNTECSGRLRAYSPAADADPAIGLFVVFPLEGNWRLGDREVVCIASALAGPTTGSLRGR